MDEEAELLNWAENTKIVVNKERLDFWSHKNVTIRYKEIIELNIMKSLLAKSRWWKLAFLVGTVASGNQDIWGELCNSVCI